VWLETKRNKAFTVGAYINPGLFNQQADAGVFVSGGAGVGFNVGVNAYIGFIKGEASNVNTPFIDVNISTAIASATILLDPDTGNFAGMTIGPAAKAGASLVYTDTGKYGLRDLVNYLNNILNGQSKTEAVCP
jgi:hypothetical protein